MQAGVPHVHPWNTGTDEMVYRQTNDFEATTPGAVREGLGALATLKGLAREGRVGKRGLPRIPFSLLRQAGFTRSTACTTQRSLFRSRRARRQPRTTRGSAWVPRRLRSVLALGVRDEVGAPHDLPTRFGIMACDMAEMPTARLIRNIRRERAT
jgi:hypothetical protein